jgi:mannitol/fructose-specific phosphotransferase system IIA component (Ntr-type)
VKLCDIVVKDAIITSLEATKRDEVIRELVGALIDAGAASESDRDALVGKVLEREKRGSTGFGRGVAVPHVKHDAAEGIRAAIGLSNSGVDFDALDKQPVYTVFLLLSPADEPEDHLRAMEIVFKNLSQDRFRSFLRQAETVDDVWTLLDEADNDLIGG